MIKDTLLVKNELKKAGIEINSVYDLVNSNSVYPEAIPFLIKLLNVVTDEKTKEGIIRALAVKQAKGLANSHLLRTYFNTPNEKQSLKWVIGNTIDVIINTKNADAILQIVKDKRNGISRQMFVLALRKIKTDEVEKTLIELLSDDEVAIHAISSLSRLKSEKALPKIAEMSSHSNKTIRKEAEKALKKLM